MSELGMGFKATFLSSLGVHDLRDRNGVLALLRRFVGEFVGTAALAALGCAGGTAEVGGRPSNLQAGLSFGLAYAAAVAISSDANALGHANPAVTAANVLTGATRVIHGLLMVVAQCAGAIGGSFLLSSLLPRIYRSPTSLGVNVIYAGQFHPNCSDFERPPEDCFVGRVDVWQGFGLEAAAAFALVAVALTLEAGNKNREGVPSTAWLSSSSLTLGLTYCLCHLALAPLTGGGANPARSLGPAVVANFWKDHWVFWCGPLLGAVVAASLHALTSSCSPETPVSNGVYRHSGHRRAEYDVTITSDEQEMRRLNDKSSQF